MKQARIILGLFLCFLTIGCSTIVRDYQYSFDKKRAEKHLVLQFGDSVRRYYFGGMPKNELEIKKEDKAELNIYSPSLKENTLFWGWNYGIPLPVLPWPSGILSSLTSPKPQKYQSIEIKLIINPKQENTLIAPYESYLLINGKRLKPTSVVPAWLVLDKQAEEKKKLPEAAYALEYEQDNFISFKFDSDEGLENEMLFKMPDIKFQDGSSISNEILLTYDPVTYIEQVVKTDWP